MEKLTQKFSARAADGTEYTLCVYQEFIDAGNRGDPNAQAPGQRRLVTDSGLSVNRVAKGKYVVVETGEELNSTDPNAP